MEVILLERVAKLGQMGEVVRVKDGYGRNFLLKRGKALRATADNRAKYDGMKADLEANNIKAKGGSHHSCREDRRPQRRHHPSGVGNRSAVRLGVGARHHRYPSKLTASPSAAARCCSTRRSRPSASTRSRSPCIRKSKSASASPLPVPADEAERINRGEDISSRQEDQDAAAEALAAAGEFFDPDAQGNAEEDNG